VIAAPLLSRFRRYVVQHRIGIAACFALVATVWLALADYQRAAARSSLEKSLGAIHPVWRLQLTPPDLTSLPDLGVSYWQFVANPFRDDVWVEYNFTGGGSGAAWMSVSDWRKQTTQ